MDAPKDLKRLNELKESARALMGKRQLDEAEAALREAMEIDEHDPQPLNLMAELLQARGDEKQALQYLARAKQIRQRNWEREVEADARGHHEVMGQRYRHEIP